MCLKFRNLITNINLKDLNSKQIISQFLWVMRLLWIALLKLKVVFVVFQYPFPYDIQCFEYKLVYVIGLENLRCFEKNEVHLIVEFCAQYSNLNFVRFELFAQLVMVTWIFILSGNLKLFCSCEMLLFNITWIYYCLNIYLSSKQLSFLI